MARYGMDYGRWGGGDRYDRQQGNQSWDRGYEGGGYGGMRSDGWGSDWRSYPGESGWFGEASPGYSAGAYDSGYRGGLRRGRESEGYDRGMQGSGYGGGFGAGYGGRDIGYGGFEYDRGRSSGGRWGVGAQGRSGRNDMRAGELMTENPECVTPDTTLTEVARKMRELNVGIIPVVESMDNRRLKGVITDRDITVRAVAAGKDGNILNSAEDAVLKRPRDGVGEYLSIARTTARGGRSAGKSSRYQRPVPAGTHPKHE